MKFRHDILYNDNALGDNIMPLQWCQIVATDVACAQLCFFILEYVLQHH